MPSDAVDVIAQEADWLVFARLLERAAADPGRLGFKSSTKALEAVAERRGVSVASLRHYRNALKYLQQAYPGIASGRAGNMGIRQVNLLGRIAAYDQAEARKLEKAIFGGEVSVGELRMVLEAVKNNAENTAVKIDPIRESVIFERIALSAVTKAQRKIFGPDQLRLENGSRLRPIPVDIVVYRESEIIGVFEVISGRRTWYQRQVVDLCARLVLLGMAYPYSALILSEEQVGLFEKICVISDQLNIAHPAAFTVLNGTLQAL